MGLQLRLCYNVCKFIYTFMIGVFGPVFYVLTCLVLKPLQIWFPDIFYVIEGHLFRCLLSFLGFWMVMDGYEIHESGADIQKLRDKRVVVMANHQSTGDVPSLFYAFHNKGSALDHIMWVIAEEFKWTPFGLASQLHGDFFIKQGRDVRDKQIDYFIQHMREYFLPLPRDWLIIFPEGGFLYKRLQSSQQFAAKHNYPHLEHVTLPRVGAIQAALQISPAPGSEILKDKGFDYILDVTIGYEPGKELSLLDIMTGCRAPGPVSFHYRIFDVPNVPISDVDEFTQWLYSCWEEKEKLLTKFYKIRKFEDKIAPRPLKINLFYAIYVHIVYAFLVYFHIYLFGRFCDLFAIFC